MPWKITKQDGQHCVVRADTGEVVKCHSDPEMARRHLAALYANTDENAMSAVERLDAKLETVTLARIWIPPYPRERNGKVEQVDGYWREIKSLADLAKLPAAALQAIWDAKGGPKIKGLTGKRQVAGNLDRLMTTLQTARSLAEKEYHDTGYREVRNPGSLADRQKWIDANLQRILAELLKGWTPEKIARERGMAGRGAGIGALHG